MQQYVAFYCGVGDFMVYDDSDDGLLAQLARDYGPGTIGTVFAHEFGHAIQLQAGNLDRALPTILTEQQSDCFAGAWTARVAHGESATVRYSDGDVTAGLIAMTKVSDPVGIDQFTEGGHGSGFDRVGAFQVGFTEGAARCAEILDDPLPLVPNQFTSFDDQNSGGNAPFGYTDDDLFGFLPNDLNLYWDQQLADTIPAMGPLELAVVSSSSGADCTDLRGDLDRGTALCAATGEVFVNEPAALDLYRSLGDFSVGYLLGSAWSEAVQEALGLRSHRRGSGARQRLPHRRLGTDRDPRRHTERTRPSPTPRPTGAPPRCRRATSTKQSRHCSSLPIRAPTTTSWAAPSRRSPHCAPGSSTAPTRASPSSETAFGGSGVQRSQRSSSPASSTGRSPCTLWPAPSTTSTTRSG